MSNDGVNAGKRRRFVQEYAVDYNGAAAAMRAGYSTRSAKVTASRLLAQPHIKAALQLIQSDEAARVALSHQAVLDQVLDGVKLARLKGDAKAMIAGLREVAKMLGYYPSSK
ncbi:MAG TPA: terminase small subunit [Burkholderiales bacterium]|jgi:phage terminase small subunit